MKHTAELPCVVGTKFVLTNKYIFPSHWLNIPFVVEEITAKYIYAVNIDKGINVHPDSWYLAHPVKNIRNIPKVQI